MWVLQTVIATSEDHRQRVGLLFDNGRGGLIQGIRIWREQRFDTILSRGRMPALSERSRETLASDWLIATGGVGCFVDASTRAPPVSDTLSTGRVLLPDVGLTVRSARGMVVVEATDTDRPTVDRQPFVRTFDQGACYVRDGGAKPSLLRTVVSARATTPRSSKTRMSASMASTPYLTSCGRLMHDSTSLSGSMESMVNCVTPTTFVLCVFVCAHFFRFRF